MQECITRTRTATTLLLKLERNGHTRNDRYYRDCKDKFLSHLKMQHGLASSENSTVVRDLNRMTSPGQPSVSSGFASAINAAKASLGKVGLSVEERSFVKLLPPQPADSALEDMASASAGFEGTPRHNAPFPCAGKSSHLHPCSCIAPICRLRTARGRHGTRSRRL